MNTALQERVEAMLPQIEFSDYWFRVDTTERGETYMQGIYREADIYTKVVELQYTRKWLLTPLMTDSEIVQTAFKMCMTSMEHKTREGFKYKGARIFGPHFDVEALVSLCLTGGEDAGGRK